MNNGIFSDDINEQRSEFATLLVLASAFVFLITVFSVMAINTGNAAPKVGCFVADLEHHNTQVTKGTAS